MKYHYLILLLLESETFGKNPGRIYRNGRLGKKGKKKNESIGKSKVNKANYKCKY